MQWSEAEKWSTDSFRSVSWAWPESLFCRLGDVLNRRDNEVVERHDLRTVPIIEKISFGGVISVTDPDEREGYRGRLFWAEIGDLIYSKIRAKQGSLGLVPSKAGRIAVSAEYPVYAPIISKVVPAYLILLLKCSAFLRFLDGLASGGDTKTRIAPDLFESLRIALPPLATQQAIVAHWQATQDKNAAAFKAADEHDVSTCRKFLEALGLSDHAQGITQRAFALQWSELERWSLGYIRQSSGNLAPDGGVYPMVRLGEVIADLFNGWSPQCFDRPAEEHEWGVLKLGAVSFGSYNDRENKALPPSLPPEPSLEIKVGDVLISRANVPRLVGACAHVTSTRAKLLLCDKIFRVILKEASPITPEYIAEVMKLPHLRRQIESSVTGSSPTMQNITKPALLALRIPLPPLAIQKQLVAEVTAARARIAAARAAAAQRAAATASEVEEMILGQRPAPGMASP